MPMYKYTSICFTVATTSFCNSYKFLEHHVDYQLPRHRGNHTPIPRWQPTTPPPRPAHPANVLWQSASKSQRRHFSPSIVTMSADKRFPPFTPHSEQNDNCDQYHYDKQWGHPHIIRNMYVLSWLNDYGTAWFLTHDNFASAPHGTPTGVSDKSVFNQRKVTQLIMTKLFLCTVCTSIQANVNIYLRYYWRFHSSL